MADNMLSDSHGGKSSKKSMIKKITAGTRANKKFELFSNQINPKPNNKALMNPATAPSIVFLVEKGNL